MNLPAKLRKYVSPEANNTFVVTRGFEKCLYVYPVDEWNKLEQKLRILSSYDPKHRRFMREILELAQECQLDTQARLMIPQDLRTYAGIQSEVRIIGTLDKIEVWNPNVYDEYKKNNPESYEGVAEEVMRQI